MVVPRENKIIQISTMIFSNSEPPIREKPSPSTKWANTRRHRLGEAVVKRLLLNFEVRRWLAERSTM
jgi:hypothetical protein